MSSTEDITKRTGPGEVASLLLGPVDDGMRTAGATGAGTGAGAAERRRCGGEAGAATDLEIQSENHAVSFRQEGEHHFLPNSAASDVPKQEN